MAGFSKTIAAYEFKQAFFEAATEHFAELEEFQVVRGLVGANIPQKYMQILGTRVRHDAATMGSNRTREEVIELETQWYVFEYGTEDADRAAEDYLFARLGSLEEHIRVSDITLGGVVRQCFLGEVATDERRIEEAGTYQGRLAAAIAIWEAPVRLRNQ